MQYKKVNETYLRFLKNMHDKGIAMSAEQRNLLVDAGYIEDSFKVFDNEKEEQDQSKVPVLKEMLASQNYHEQKNLPTDIPSSAWKLPSTTKYETEFILWVNSINSGFKNMVPYHRFETYCKQAYAWINEPDFSGGITQDEYEEREIYRCKENTLYFAEKYGWVQEQDPMVDTPEFRYIASIPQRILCFIYDLGVNVIFAKGRQITASTTFGLCMLKTLVFRTNAYVKFVSQDEDKGQEIFDFKVKYPYTRLPDFLRPKSRNYAAGKISFGYGKKGEKEGANSTLEVAPPTNTVISGGSPTEIIIDEAGNIKNLGKIIENGMPTLFGQDRKTGEIRMKRRFIAFGTGGEMDKGGDAFQTEFMVVHEKWMKGDYRPCIVPLFFDWTARVGITKEYYDLQKEIFYSKEGPKAEESKVEFHQQYPDNLEDVFMRKANTLVDTLYINKRIKAITQSGAKFKRGYFEPIFGDIKQPENSDIPFNIVGANFIPTEDIDPRATVLIFLDPQKGWKNRYWQGTDPIASDSGQSNMSSAVWDAHFNSIAAILDFRSQDTNYVYLQTLLLGLYYSEDGGETPIPELIESNLGKAYSLYKMSKGRKFESSLVLNSELPQGFRNQSSILYGIDTKGVRKRLMVNKLFEIISIYGEHIYIPTFWGQLKTFHCEKSDKGNDLWGPLDRRYHRDDELDATTFSYICRECFPTRICQGITMNDRKVIVRSKLVRQKDLTFKRVSYKARK